MDDELPTIEQIDQVESPRPSKALVIALLVVAVVLGLVLGRLAIPSRSASTGSLTAAGNDAMVDYQAAVRTGRPVYVLFHSLS